jgi:hypothetical protein
MIGWTDDALYHLSSIYQLDTYRIKLMECNQQIINILCIRILCPLVDDELKRQLTGRMTNNNDMFNWCNIYLQEIYFKAFSFSFSYINSKIRHNLRTLLPLQLKHYGHDLKA